MASLWDIKTLRRHVQEAYAVRQSFILLPEFHQLVHHSHCQPGSSSRDLFSSAFLCQVCTQHPLDVLRSRSGEKSPKGSLEKPWEEIGQMFLVNQWSQFINQTLAEANLRKKGPSTILCPSFNEKMSSSSDKKNNPRSIATSTTAVAIVYKLTIASCFCHNQTPPIATFLQMASIGPVILQWTTKQLFLDGSARIQTWNLKRYGLLARWDYRR